MKDHIALLCDPARGTIVELLNLPEGIGLTVGERVDELVEAGSRPKLGALLAAIHREGYAIGWELVLPVAATLVPFHFAGAQLGEHLLLLAWIAERDLAALVDELTRLNNEQTNRLRDALKELSRRPPSNDLYNEMSRLNSELATVQRELARRNAHLEQLNREKNELLGMAAHDLRNPMAAVLGLSQHLLRDAERSLSPRHVEMLEHLRDSSEHMLALVEDLLSLASLEEGTLRLQLAPTDLPELVGRAVRLARELAADRDVKIRYERGCTGHVVAALDAHKITQAIDNLLSNAVKFSHPGSAVEVRLSCDDGVAQIAVEDHGVGIDEAVLRGLFEPFRPGRAGVRGEKTTGLGLAIVQRIVRGHGGEVEVESTRDVGTTFTLHVPLRAFEGPAEAPLPAAPAPARRLSVLVADDDPISRLILRVLLEESGHRVVASESASAAIEALDTERFDLVIVDVEMPGGGGAAVSEALSRGDARRIPILALTGHTGEKAAHIARSRAFDGILSKPPRRPELAAHIDRLVRAADPS
ncbi:MAG: hybrid sensor histidine kinase/response regulator [Nannocystaceae bacterium]